MKLAEVAEPLREPASARDDHLTGAQHPQVASPTKPRHGAARRRRHSTRHPQETGRPSARGKRSEELHRFAQVARQVARRPSRLLEHARAPRFAVTIARIAVTEAPPRRALTERRNVPPRGPSIRPELEAENQVQVEPPA